MQKKYKFHRFLNNIYLPKFISKSGRFFESFISLPATELESSDTLFEAKPFDFDSLLPLFCLLLKFNFKKNYYYYNLKKNSNDLKR